MDNNLDNNLDSEQFSLESILAEYLEGDFDADGGQSIEEKSRSIMRSALGDTVAEAHAASAEPAGRAEDEPAFGDEPEPAAEDGIPEPETESFGPADEAERYSDIEASPSPKTTHRAARPARKKSLAETLMAPVLSLLASAAAKHAETVRDEHMTAKPVDEGPELPPKKAAKLYAMQETVNDQFLWETDEEEQMNAIYKALIDSLGDKYSVYMDKEEYANWNNYVNGTFTGVGITFAEDDEGNFVITDLAAGPGWEESICLK